MGDLLVPNKLNKFAHWTREDSLAKRTSSDCNGSSGCSTSCSGSGCDSSCDGGGDGGGD